jgi:molecular chaperone GrpE
LRNLLVGWENYSPGGTMGEDNANIEVNGETSEAQSKEKQDSFASYNKQDLNSQRLTVSEDAEEENVDSLKKKIDILKKTSENNLEKLRYLLADYDNYRKKTEAETETKIECSRVDLLSKLISIEDDLSKNIGPLKGDDCPPAIIEGLNGILKNLDSLLKSEGVRVIEALETPFDPRLHKVASRVPSIYHADNVVVDVIRKGFMLDNKVLRPSSVILSSHTISNINTVHDLY